MDVSKCSINGKVEVVEKDGAPSTPMGYLLVEPSIACLQHPGLDTASRANAELICEAFTVAHETGLSPRQLAEQRRALLDALELVCATLARDRDSASLPAGWVERLKYEVVDRAIEFALPGYDGGETSAEQYTASANEYRAALAACK